MRGPTATISASTTAGSVVEGETDNFPERQDSESDGAPADASRCGTWAYRVHDFESEVTALVLFILALDPAYYYSSRVMDHHPAPEIRY